MRRLLLSALLLPLFACGDDGARALFNDSVAQLRAGNLVAAEIAAEKAAARGGAELFPARDFVLGCGAFRRCESEEIRIYGPRGGTAAIVAALEHAKSARDLFASAAAGPRDWPEARRNVERAIQKIVILQAMKEEADAKAQSRPQPQPKPMTSNDPGTPKDQSANRRPTPRPEPAAPELPPDQVTRVLERLSDKEKEKAKVRRAEHQAQRALVEKDW